MSRQFAKRVSEFGPERWILRGIRLLDQVPSELPYLERIFLSDLEGVLRADTPPHPGVRGESFAHRDWYGGASLNWTPYISETYVRSAHPPNRVVAAAIPIRSNRSAAGGEPTLPIGILVLQMRVGALVEWSGEIFRRSSGSVYFVDQRGQVVAHPEPGGEDGEKRIRAATGRMDNLIDDLLNLSRVSRAQMTTETVDLSAAMAHDIIAELKEHEPRRRVEERIADGLVSECDPRLIRVALENLLGNAWKFTNNREIARIEFGKEDNRDGHPTFFVSDNGAGFHMKYVDKLFGAFQRLHSAQDFPGTGIGLATVQRIIRRHGGWMRAEGKPGEGAAIRFRIHASLSISISYTKWRGGWNSIGSS